jgi:methylated-DNA-[protein]-cysteine S-methyltransferase
MPTTFARIASPIGELVLTASDTGLTGVYFPTSRHGPPPLESADWVEDDGRRPASPILARARRQLEEYFAGTRTTFEVPLAPTGTPFEQRVWEALRAIPYGTTTSYGVLARRLGDPRATRAVGAANGRNPIPIIVPCHRVVGARGELTGFGGGIDRKRWLLEHEGALMRLGG